LTIGAWIASIALAMRVVGGLAASIALAIDRPQVQTKSKADGLPVGCVLNLGDAGPVLG